MRRFSFISGKKNEESLNIEYSLNNGIVTGKFCPQKAHRSYPDIVHGGLMAAILDDAMAFSINNTGVVALTAKMEIRYKKPITINKVILIEARVENKKRNLYFTTGSIKNLDNDVLIEANAVFMIKK